MKIEFFIEKKEKKLIFKYFKLLKENQIKAYIKEKQCFIIEKFRKKFKAKKIKKNDIYNVLKQNYLKSLKIQKFCLYKKELLKRKFFVIWHDILKKIYGKNIDSFNGIISYSDKKKSQLKNSFGNSIRFWLEKYEENDKFLKNLQNYNHYN